jgi:cell wall-associated NlpC family hydrolase
LRVNTPGCIKAWPAKALAGSLILVALVAPAPATAASASDGGAELPQTPPSPSAPDGTQPAPVEGALAKLSPDGRSAIPPALAPEPVQQAVYAANRITRKPYIYGGGHASFRARGYDCSGAVSYVLRGAGLLDSPLDSGRLMRWAEPGLGAWITVYTNRGHAYAVIAGLRFDTSGPGERGPRWRAALRSNRGFKARHPLGL